MPFSIKKITIIGLYVLVLSTIGPPINPPKIAELTHIVAKIPASCFIYKQ